MERKQLGERIENLRVQLDWSQRILSKRTGISQATLSRIESGDTPANHDQLNAIADAFGILVGELMDPALPIVLKIVNSKEIEEDADTNEP